MENKTKYVIGFLTLILLASGVVYISLENVRLRVDNDKSTFYVKNDNNRWVVSGREYNSLFDGTKKMNRDKKSIKINTDINYEISYDASAFYPERQFQLSGFNLIIQGEKQNIKIH